MIIIESKRKKQETIKRLYPDCSIIDVTSKADKPWIRLSPFYPHGGIPVPDSPEKATCVEAIWQGLKVFEHADIDTTLFTNETMRNLKRTVRRWGMPLGHRKGTKSKELLSYIEARKQIYIPTYRWMLEHKAAEQVAALRELSRNQTVVLLDYTTNSDYRDTKKPLSHAALIKAYIEGLAPYEEQRAYATPKSTPKKYIQQSLNFDTIKSDGKEK